MRILRVHNTDSDFYIRLGPFLSRREIVKELGHPIWDDDAKQWFVADQTGVPAGLLGFAGLLTKGTRSEIVSVYVRPTARRQGVFRALLKAVLAAVPDEVQRVQATATAMSRPHFLGAGFKAVRRHGRYWKVERRNA